MSVPRYRCILAIPFFKKKKTGHPLYNKDNLIVKYYVNIKMIYIYSQGNYWREGKHMQIYYSKS
jgi:hypothetical protein